MPRETNAVQGIFPGEIIRSVRKFGVEIELTQLDKGAFRNDMQKYDIPYFEAGYRGSTRQERNQWELKGDGSVHGMALELISPPLSGPKGAAELKLVLELVRLNGGKVDESCGLHVHHSASDLSDSHLKNLLIIWHKYQDMMYMICDPRRESNHFCKKLPESKFRQLLRMRSGFGAGIRSMERYMGLNFESLNRHGTVEFRLLEGMLNGEKIEAWIGLTQRLVLLAKHTAKPIKPNRVGMQVRLLGAITRMVTQNGFVASEKEEQAFLLLSTVFHKNKRARKRQAVPEQPQLSTINPTRPESPRLTPEVLDPAGRLLADASMPIYSEDREER